MATPFNLRDLNPYYRRMLGRDASDDELQPHAANPGGFEGAIGAIANSQEARDYAARPTTATSAAPPGPSPGALSGAQGLEGRRGWNNLLLDSPGQVNPGTFRGFNDDRALSGGDPNSTKDAFRRFIGGQNYNPAGQSKDQIGEWLASLIPSARQAGLNILDTRGDQILIETAERGPEWVDVVQNAGGDDVAWQWLTQQEFGNADQGGFPDAFSQLRGLPGGSDMLTALLMDGGLSGSPLMQRIQEELQKLLAGQTGGGPPTPGSAGIENLLPGVL